MVERGFHRTVDEPTFLLANDFYLDLFFKYGCYCGLGVCGGGGLISHGFVYSIFKMNKGAFLDL